MKSSVLSITDVVLTNALPKSGDFDDDVCGLDTMNGKSWGEGARGSSLSFMHTLSFEGRPSVPVKHQSHRREPERTRSSADRY